MGVREWDRVHSEIGTGRLNDTQLDKLAQTAGSTGKQEDVDAVVRALYFALVHLADRRVVVLGRRHAKTDMIHEGVFGVLTALQVWEPGRAPFRQYALRNAEWRMTKHTLDMFHPVRLDAKFVARAAERGKAANKSGVKDVTAYGAYNEGGYFAAALDAGVEEQVAPDVAMCEYDAAQMSDYVAKHCADWVHRVFAIYLRHSMTGDTPTASTAREAGVTEAAVYAATVQARRALAKWRRL